MLPPRSPCLISAYYYPWVRFKAVKTYDDPSYFIEWAVTIGRHEPRTFGLPETFVATAIS
jgi:hypothetical protein